MSPSRNRNEKASETTLQVELEALVIHEIAVESQTEKNRKRFWDSPELSDPYADANIGPAGLRKLELEYEIRRIDGL